jgi:NADH-quinone oxidoreductase subunit M
VYAAMFLIAALSSMGLPALNGFIGEFTILLGAANSTAFGTMTYAVIAAIGIVLGAAYLLWMYQRVFWGPLDNPENAKVSDMNGREIGMMLALVALMVWIGIYPKPLFDIIEKPVAYVVQKVEPAYYDAKPIEYPASPVAPAAHGHPEVAAK